MALDLHLSPILINKHTGEPFLRLPFPHSNIILTPPRASDSDAIVPILNDRRVFRWLDGPPYPYNIDHARAWLEITSKASDDVIQELKEKGSGYVVEGCPVRTLREVTDSGEEIFLGDCVIRRWLFDDIADPEERERLTKENEKRLPTDPETQWGIGDYLAPSHHGRGIMSAALGTLISQWFIPRMGTKTIKANVWKGNHGSVRVFEKNGFVIEKTLENYRAIAESKGGGTIGMHVMLWRA
ncbi:acyl-CoA N-acyltransferase [Ramaria rubella]|nr:acyl-CoA N-acyltransferase [Ramaria rubella]